MINDDMEDVNFDMTDSEEEYTEREKYLLEKVRKKKVQENFDSEDEVYGLQEEEDEDAPDSMGSDVEGLQDDYDLPNEKAWGKKKRAYYATDYVDPDYSTTNEKDMAEAELEEQEARNIQKRLAEQLDDADFGLDLIHEKDNDHQNDNQQIIKTDLSKLGERQKQALIQKESPEFAGLVNDLKDRLKEAKDILDPFLKLVREGKCLDCRAVTFVKTKYQLILNYSINISFYLMLKAKRIPVNSHPVIKRLAQYRQLLDQLESGQEKLLDEVTRILDAVRRGQPLYNTLDNSEIRNEKERRSSAALGEKLNRARQGNKVIKTESHEFTVEDIDNGDAEEELGSKGGNGKEEFDIGEEEVNENEEQQDRDVEFEPDNGKRAITYQIAKNKGLTPHRKKEQRNPRVKHRNKYRKAKIRRKGAVREVRKEVSRYGGEISGIKASVKKSIKLK